jgi:hypothetical protein
VNALSVGHNWYNSLWLIGQQVIWLQIAHIKLLENSAQWVPTGSSPMGSKDIVQWGISVPRCLIDNANRENPKILLKKTHLEKILTDSLV